MEKIDGYYYLHQDGSLIWKNPIVVQNSPDYFTSPFVKKVWHCNSADRGNAWQIALEALALGCPTTRIQELTNKWKLTYKDSLQMLMYVPPTELMKEGLDIFIEEILGMEIEEYWTKVKVDWDKITSEDKKEEEDNDRGPVPIN